MKVDNPNTMLLLLQRWKMVQRTIFQVTSRIMSLAYKVADRFEIARIFMKSSLKAISPFTETEEATNAGDACRGGGE